MHCSYGKKEAEKDEQKQIIKNIVRGATFKNATKMAFTVTHLYRIREEGGSACPPPHPFI